MPPSHATRTLSFTSTQSTPSPNDVFLSQQSTASSPSSIPSLVSAATASQQAANAFRHLVPISPAARVILLELLQTLVNADAAEESSRAAEATRAGHSTGTERRFSRQLHSVTVKHEPEPLVKQEGPSEAEQATQRQERKRQRHDSRERVEVMLISDDDADENNNESDRPTAATASQSPQAAGAELHAALRAPPLQPLAWIPDWEGKESQDRDCEVEEKVHNATSGPQTNSRRSQRQSFSAFKRRRVDDGDQAAMDGDDGNVRTHRQQSEEKLSAGGEEEKGVRAPQADDAVCPDCGRDAVDADGIYCARLCKKWVLHREALPDLPALTHQAQQQQHQRQQNRASAPAADPKAAMHSRGLPKKGCTPTKASPYTTSLVLRSAGSEIQSRDERVRAREAARSQARLDRSIQLSTLYIPRHNIPLYPCYTRDLHAPQLPFAILAHERLDVSAPIVKAYLDHQLLDCPSVRLAKPGKPNGLFAARAISAHTQLHLPVFGLLYSRDELLDEDEADDAARSRRAKTRRPEAKELYMIEFDALDANDTEVLMSVSRACVAHFIQYTQRRLANVKTEYNQRVSRRWRLYAQTRVHEEEGVEAHSWVPSALMVVRTTKDIAEGEELLLPDAR